MNLERQNGHHVDSQMQSSPVCRGVRGATTVAANSAEAIVDATYDLLNTMVQLNDMHPDDIASIYFTTTVDLNADYPAKAARRLGWTDVALMCGHEMRVPGSLPRCIRVLIHWNTRRRPKEVIHVYLREAKVLRPDRQDRPPVRPIQMTEVEAAVRLLGCSL
jgi:chorismate mutase